VTTPKERLDRLERRRERILREAEVCRLVEEHRAASGLSKCAIATALGISTPDYMRKADPECRNHFSAADHRVLCELMPSYAAATAPKAATTAAASLQAAVARVGLAVAELAVEAEEATRDHVVLPSEAARVRHRLHAAQVTIATVEATLGATTTVV
jgi:hypothetical protein